MARGRVLVQLICSGQHRLHLRLPGLHRLHQLDEDDINEHIHDVVNKNNILNNDNTVTNHTNDNLSITTRRITNTLILHN